MTLLKNRDKYWKIYRFSYQGGEMDSQIRYGHGYSGTCGEVVIQSTEVAQSKLLSIKWLSLSLIRNILSTGTLAPSSLLLLILIYSPAQASLLGQTVTVHQGDFHEAGVWRIVGGDWVYFDEAGMIYDNDFDPTTLGPIVNGASDSSMVPVRGGFLYDFDENSFSISLNRVTRQWAPAPVFNGEIIDGFSPSVLASISGYTLTNEIYDVYGNLVNFTEDRISITSDGIFMNYQDLIFFDGVLTVNLEFTAVPLPASAWLFFGGLISLTGMSKKNKKKIAGEPGRT